MLVACHTTLSISYSLAWSLLSDINLADPQFGQPGKIDVLLGVDIFVQVMQNGRGTGSPAAFKTEFGWVLAGEVSSSAHGNLVSSHHISLEMIFSR